VTELSKKISKDKIRCNLCPHFCVLKEGQVGKCFARNNLGGESHHLYLGSISCLAVEPIEKKPFKHFLPMTKTLTYGSRGCSLHCKYCESNSISQVSPKNTDNFIGPVIMPKMAKEKNCKSISMSYNEPTISYEYLIDLGERLEQEDLKFLLKTNAYVNKYPWKEICRVTDAMNIDYKGSEEKFKSITGVDKYVLQDRIKEAYDYGVHLEISFPLYYKDDEIEDEMKIAGEFLSSFSSDIPCHLLSIQSAYKYSDFVFKSENMDRAKNILSQYMNNIYVVK